MSKLYNGFKGSDIIQGILAIALCGAICYLSVTGQEVPTALIGAFGVILGYYFRTNNVVNGGA